MIGAVERQGLTLIPLELYFKRGKAKVALALGKGKSLRQACGRKAPRRRARHASGGSHQMIAVVLALQIAAAPASAPIPTFIVVRDGATVTSVPVYDRRRRSKHTR